MRGMTYVLWLIPDTSSATQSPYSSVIKMWVAYNWLFSSVLDEVTSIELLFSYSTSTRLLRDLSLSSPREDKLYRDSPSKGISTEKGYSPHILAVWTQLARKQWTSPS